MTLDKPTFHAALRLIKDYPEAFSLNEPKPLKIGIHKDILARDVTLSGVRVRKIMAWYTNRPAYRSQLKANAPRYALDGSVDGEVTEEQAKGSDRPRFRKTKRATVPGDVLPNDVQLTEDNVVFGILEVTVKFSQLPKAVKLQSGYKFAVDCDGRRITATVKPKAWNKLLTAAQEYPQWIAALTGKLGAADSKGFILDEPGLQVFEKKVKAPSEAPEVKAPAAPSPVVNSPTQYGRDVKRAAVERKPLSLRSSGRW